MTSSYFDDEGGRGVRDLVRQLARDLGVLANQTVTLLKAEFRGSVQELGRNAALVGAAAVIVLLGFGLLVWAVALWIGRLVDSPAGGFAITGGGLILLAAILAVMGVRGLRRLRRLPAPRCLRPADAQPDVSCAWYSARRRCSSSRLGKRKKTIAAPSATATIPAV